MTVPPNDYQPTWRKPAGMAIILILIIAWAWAVSTMIEWFGNIPTVAAIPIYAITGIVWIVPLRPLLLWMETGRWRQP